jgi:alanyl-tRNA synthetase
MIRVDSASEFKGYDALELTGKVTALFVDGKAVDSISAGQDAVILDKTPFYAESGGQVGDKGELKGNGFQRQRHPEIRSGDWSPGQTGFRFSESGRGRAGER